MRTNNEIYLKKHETSIRMKHVTFFSGILIPVMEIIVVHDFLNNISNLTAFIFTFSVSNTSSF